MKFNPGNFSQNLCPYTLLSTHGSIFRKEKGGKKFKTKVHSGQKS